MVELLSPSTALYDLLNLKKAAYQRLGVPSYWVVDPTGAACSPSSELDQGGSYQQLAQVKGEEPFEAVRPFPVRIVPAQLLNRLG